MSAAFFADLDLDLDLAAALEHANAGRARAIEVLAEVMRLFDDRAMSSHADQCVLREARALLAEYGLDPDAARAGEMTAAYEEWASKR